MIVTGYQGIGKSTLAKRREDVIDLESSCFWKKDESGNRTRPNDWYVYYCQMAEHLSKQGYTVFVSCHPEVREYISHHGTESFCMICPHPSLKDAWINRLHERYQSTKLEKDLRALEHAEKFFDQDIDKLMKECSDNNNYYSGAAFIKNIDYDLEETIISLQNKENTKQLINKLLEDTTAGSKAEVLESLDAIIKFVDELGKYIDNNADSFKTMNSLQPNAPVIGYQIEYRGQEPINTYRISPLTRQLEPFTIPADSVINLNRAEMAILSSLPEIGCTFRNGKVVNSSKRINGDLYTMLNSYYLSFNEGGIAGKEIMVQQVEKTDIIEKYFQRGDERLQAKTGMTITKQILDMLKIKNALSNKSIDVNEQSVKDAITSGQLDISKINKQSENITVVRTLTDANSHTAITQIIGYQILYKGTEPIETYRVSPIDKQLTPFVINPSDKVCINRMEMAILASKEEVGCKFSNGILTKSSKSNQVNDLHAWLNSWYFALNDSHGATVYDMALPIQSVETPETIRKYFLTTGERTAQQKQAINNATGIKGLMGAFKR